MDPLGLIYYAVVCGALALWSPVVSSRVMRVVIGLAVGGVSSLGMPLLRSLFGN